MKEWLFLFISGCLSTSALAADLTAVYRQSQETNPTLKAAAATRDAAYSSVSVTRANLLPQLGLSANYGHTSGYREADGSRSKNGSLGASLSQSLFDYSRWKSLDITQKQASLQDISYQSQEQIFVLTIASAYFNVLSALDNLDYTKAQLAAFKRQMEEAQQKYDVGLVAITDVQNAKANYDLTRAQLVTSVNSLNNALESLREQSGVFYDEIATLNTKKFKTESLQSLDQFLALAKNNNLQLLSSRLSVDIARENVSLARSGHLPTISLQGSSTLTKAQNYGYNNDYTVYNSTNKITGGNTIGVSVSLPIFSGGSVLAQTDQAKYNYISSSEQLEANDRTIINNVNTYYNNVNASVIAIGAYEQAVASAKSSLNATESGYSVGTRTIVDVLNATTQLYSALKNLSSARYDYLLSVLQLKQASGILTSADLDAINPMLDLEKNIASELVQRL